jgi:hypothetical protein
MIFPRKDLTAKTPRRQEISNVQFIVIQNDGAAGDDPQMKPATTAF